MTMHNVIPMPSWHRSAEAWAHDLTASDEIRRAAIQKLVEANSLALASINDPVGIRMVSDARQRHWATADSEIAPRPDMAQMEGGAVDFAPEVDTLAAQVIFAMFGAGIGICIGVLLWLAYDDAAARAQADLDRAEMGAW